MATRLLVCISAASVTVALWKGSLGTCLHFDPDEGGEAEFALMLKTMPGVPVLFLVDSVDEDYRLETLPHVGGSDRRAMLERRLRQTYRTSPFVSARVQNRKRTRGRRSDDDFLLAALTETSAILPWVEIAVAQRMPIVGIFTAPTVMPAAVTPLGLTASAQLLVSRHAAGMRQTFLRDGQFRFSRLTPLRGANDTSVGGSTGAEIINTRMYLNTLQATTADEIVDVVILDQDDSLVPLHDSVAAAQGPVRVRRIGRQELMRRLKIPDTAFSATPDALPLHLLGRANPLENLAPARLQEGYRIHQTGRVLLGATAGIAAIAVVWFAVNLTAVSRIEAETVAIARETAQLQATYAELTRQFPASPAPAPTLKLAVDAFEHIRTHARTPEDLFGVISRTLETHPTITLNSIGWRHSRAADAAAAFATAGLAAPGTANAQLRQFGLITGEITPFRGDFRTAVVTIRQFAEDLRRDPRVVEAKILKLPLDDSSRQALAGSTNARVEQQVGAQFEISIVLREPGGAS